VDVDSAAAAAAVVPYVVQAVETFGEKVLEKSADAAAEGAAGFGARLVARLLRRGDGRPLTGRGAAVESAVRDLAATPSDAEVQAAARVAVRKLLDEDPGLAAEVVGLLDRARIEAGDRSITIGSQSGGANVTGDRNRVTYRQGR
jgi:hypothetical protein